MPTECLKIVAYPGSRWCLSQFGFEDILPGVCGSVWPDDWFSVGVDASVTQRGICSLKEDPKAPGSRPSKRSNPGRHTLGGRSGKDVNGPSSSDPTSNGLRQYRKRREYLAKSRTTWTDLPGVPEEKKGRRTPAQRKVESITEPLRCGVPTSGPHDDEGSGPHGSRTPSAF